MKKLLFGTILFVGLILFPVMSMAQVSVRINVPLPPPIPFVGPPHVVVLPGTAVYAVPDIPEEIFFRSGWWWRHHNGFWYRSRYYDRGWAHYRGYPSWHRSVPPDWRYRYSSRYWGSRPWNPHPLRYGNKGYPPGWGHPPGRPSGYQGGGKRPGGPPPGGFHPVAGQHRGYR